MTQVPVNLATIFRGNVQRALAEKDWTQRDLARALNVSDARISQLLHDSAPITTDLAERIAATLKVPHFSLFVPARVDVVGKNPKNPY